jgi:ketosteroid isomerase-like protein
MGKRESAFSPNELSELLLSNLNDGDVEGIVSIYSKDAILVLPDGSKAIGQDAIRAFYVERCKDRPKFAPGEQSPPLISGHVALTSTVLPNGTVTVEVAVRQEDGTWLWVIDHPAIGFAASQMPRKPDS